MGEMTPELHTARLVLRPLALEDAAQVQVLFPEWQIVKYLAAGVPWPYPEDGALVHYRDVVLPAVERGESWVWTLRLKTDANRIIGSIALSINEDKNRGFWMSLPWQGRGLMSEASDAVTDFWFDTLGFPVLRVPKAVINTRSRRISQKSGMRVVRTEMRDYVSGRYLSEVWEITAEEWRARRIQRRLTGLS